MQQANIFTSADTAATPDILLQNNATPKITITIAPADKEYPCE